MQNNLCNLHRCSRERAIRGWESPLLPFSQVLSSARIDMRKPVARQTVRKSPTVCRATGFRISIRAELLKKSTPPLRLFGMPSQQYILREFEHYHLVRNESLHTRAHAALLRALGQQLRLLRLARPMCILSERPRLLGFFGRERVACSTLSGLP